MSLPERLALQDTADAVAAGRLAVRAVVEASLARVRAYEAVQPEVWIARREAADLLARADALDRRLAAGERLPLAGATFAVKDNIDVEGLQTTAACPAFAYAPEASAPVVARLEAAGAIALGKTNLDQFATGLSGARSPYGACRSVYNLAYVSGGSSSGSAVAVAAGLVSFALGTDTAGSGRVPAALNNLVGLKPTRGRWSARGVVPACQSLDCVTVFASSAADAARIDAVAAGFDPLDPYARPESGAPGGFPAPLRLAVPRADQLEWFGDAASARLFDAALARAERLGARLARVDIQPLIEAARLLYEGPYVAERLVATEALLLSRPAAIHPVVRGILEGARTRSAADLFRAMRTLGGHARACAAIFADADALLLPTAPTTYRLDAMLAEPLALNANLGRYTNFVNLLDLSAVAVPAGFRDTATAFGVSFIAPAWRDRALLDLASAFEQAEPAPATPPLDLAGRPEGVRVAVVGAHLAGMPLHWQLTSREARLVRRCRTASAYRLYAMRGTQPPKPALEHVGEGGASIEVEVYALTAEAFGSFVAEVPPPLAIGTVELEDGEAVKGFVAEPRAFDGARDITGFGGWRAFIASGH